MAQVSIFFGSQSGTAEYFADELLDDAAEHDIQAEVVDLQHFEPEAFAACRIAVLIVATYGDGEPTDNAAAFHRWASNPAHDGALKGQRFCVMGLGDMNYTNFNNMGKMTDANLERLGSRRIYGRGTGDDCQDIQEDFKRWKTGGLWDSLKQAIAEVEKDGGFKKAGAATMGPKLKLHMADTEEGLPQEDPEREPRDTLARFYFESQWTKVVGVRELRQAPDPSEGLATAEIEIEARGSLQGYSLGGTLALLPESDPSDVAAMLPLLGLSTSDLEKHITFLADGDRNAAVKEPFPTPCTLGEALSRYCDLSRAPPKKMVSSMRSKFEPDVQDRLGKLLQDEGEAWLHKLQAGVSCCRMHEFWALLGVQRLDLFDFLLFCPRQRAREFTIASSPTASPERILLCVSLTSHDKVGDLGDAAQALRDLGAAAPGAPTALPGRDRFFGLCSRWLTTRLKSGDTVLAKQRPSTLHLPEKDVPVLMVGAGAGVAPFRGFWEELRRGKQKAPAALFFGCRNPNKDWLFKEEMNAAVKLENSGCIALARVQTVKRPLSSLFLAFSRPDEGQGQYVQDLVRSQKETVKLWVEVMKGCVFICGSTAMGTATLEALGEAFEGGQATVDALRQENRIVVEMWG